MKTRVVHTGFYNDEKILSMPHNDRCVYLYLITNEQINICGIYPVSPRRIGFDLDLPVEGIMESLISLEKRGRIAYKDGWVCILRSDKYSSYTGEKNDVARVKELSKVPKWFLDYVSNLELDDTSIDTSIYTHPIPTSNKKPVIRNKKDKQEVDMSDEHFEQIVGDIPF